MASEVNRHGLNRNIPADVRREVRRRSKFGCVICRRGVFQYEHIDPPFSDATDHIPDGICCLCGACHDLVTRGQLSKGRVKAAYENITGAAVEDVLPPTGPLDFSSGEARLGIGGLVYHPMVSTVLRYHGEDLITLRPGSAPGEPGVISARFTDSRGEPSAAIDENGWIGDANSWDIEVTGQRLQVRPREGEIALALRMEPPTSLIVERLDMRVGDGHVLVSEDAYAVGRYVSEDLVHWAFARVRFFNPPPEAIAIEFADPEELEARDSAYRSQGSDVATDGRWFVVNGRVGCLFKPLGIAVATLCTGLEFTDGAIGPRPLKETRDVLFNKPDQLGEFISSGKYPPGFWEAQAIGQV